MVSCNRSGAGRPNRGCQHLDSSPQDVAVDGPQPRPDCFDLGKFGKSPQATLADHPHWFKTHIPKTKVITLNTSTFFFEKRHLFVLSSSAYPNSATSKNTDPKRWSFFALNLSMAVSQGLDAPTKPVRSKRSMLVKPMKIS